MPRRLRKMPHRPDSVGKMAKAGVTFPASAAREASVPSIPNLQKFLDTWLCDANKNGMPYYYFEFFDAPWKIWPDAPAA